MFNSQSIKTSEVKLMPKPFTKQAKVSLDSAKKIERSVSKTSNDSDFSPRTQLSIPQQSTQNEKSLKKKKK